MQIYQQAVISVNVLIMPKSLTSYKRLCVYNVVEKGQHMDIVNRVQLHDLPL